jgi:hypothetical protein
MRDYEVGDFEQRLNKGFKTHTKDIKKRISGEIMNLVPKKKQRRVKNKAYQVEIQEIVNYTVVVSAPNKKDARKEAALLLEYISYPHNVVYEVTKSKYINTEEV